MSVYYNEIDPFAAAWLRELIKAGLIADGEVDERSIEVVEPADLVGFTQCHFFAGIGGWSYALRLAGWPDDRAVWTGSCPCQPFSSAGAQTGGHDPRDLWPVWFQLVKECRPSVVFGEQVEAAIEHGWLDRLCDDLEAEGYAVGAVCLPGPCVGAFDIRQRLWFVAESEDERHEWAWTARRRRDGLADSGDAGELADANGWHAEHGSVQRSREHGLRAEGGRAAGRAGVAEQPEGELADAGSPLGKRRENVGRPAGSDPSLRVEKTTDDQRGGGAGELADAEEPRSSHRRTGTIQSEPCASGGNAGELGDTNNTGPQGRPVLPERPDERTARATGLGGFWSDVEWIPCLDGKARPVEPGTFPLASGVSARVGRLRGYGNAIKPQVAQAFIEAYLDAQGMK